MTKFIRASLFFALTVLLTATVSCTKDTTGGGSGGFEGDSEVNHDMDGLLRKNYLWNEEYATLTPDFSLSYDEFLSDLLMSMKTNTLDKKLRNGKYRLYSNIQRLSPVSRAAISADIDDKFQKEKVFGFGAFSVAIFSFNEIGGQATGLYGFAVMGVYPDSPMQRAGIRRGSMITQVNGQNITNRNLNSVYSQLLAPGQVTTLTLSENRGEEGVFEHRLTSELMYENPVLYTDVITEGSHKIGYLVYSSFDAAFDGELLDALQTFKSAGINELILDLRLNGGGYVMSSQMLASCIAGSRAEGQVFQYYRYNDTRMATPETTSEETGQPYDESKERFYEEFISGDYRGVDLHQYTLDLPRLYVIVSSRTASASEAVISALQGIGVGVTLVGETTSGKNVGMEGVYLLDNRYEYLFMPITFQGYNARLETVNPNGLTPDAVRSDWNNGYNDFGDRKDPCLAYAMTSITGKTYTTSALREKGTPKMQLVEGLSLPEVSRQPEGMIVLPHRS